MSDTQKCDKELPECSTCSRLGKACAYPGRPSQTSTVAPLNQEPGGRVHQQPSVRESRPLSEELQPHRLESEQYQKESPVSSFTAINHPQQPPVLPPDQQSVDPPESQLQIDTRLATSNPPEDHHDSAVSTTSMPPPSKTNLQQMHDQGFGKPATPDVLHPDDHLVIVKETQKRVQEQPDNHQTNINERKAAEKAALNDDWAIDRLSNTLVYIRAGDGWDNITSMDLGSSRDVDYFFTRVSHELEEVVVHLSILLPANVAQLENYVAQIEQGNQAAFEKMLDILLEGIERLGAGRPMRYVLAGTATCQ